MIDVRDPTEVVARVNGVHLKRYVMPSKVTVYSYSSAPQRATAEHIARRQES